MSKFIIQSRNINGNLIPMHDFGIELINAIEYQKWFRGETEHEFVLVEKDSPEYAEFIPVGSVEFVSKHMILYKNVKKVKQNHDDSIPLKFALSHKGNVNMILGIVGLVALQWITALLYTLI